MGWALSKLPPNSGSMILHGGFPKGRDVASPAASRGTGTSPGNRWAGKTTSSPMHVWMSKYWLHSPSWSVSVYPSPPCVFQGDLALQVWLESCGPFPSPSLGRRSFSVLCELMIRTHTDVCSTRRFAFRPRPVFFKLECVSESPR